MNSNWVGCSSVVVHSSLHTMKNGTNLCWVVSGWKGERSLKAGTEVIDDWEENRREFLARFLSTCNAEKLHMMAGWACQGWGSQVMGGWGKGGVG